MRFRIAPILCVALLAAACARSGGTGDALRVVPLEGDVFVASDDSPVTEAEEISPGEVVRTGENGRAVVEFPDGQAAELAPGSRLGVGGPAGAEVLRGQVLFRGTTGLAVGSGPAQIQGTDGYFRVDRYVGALRLGVYSGSAAVQGWDGQVRALEEVGVSAGVVPGAPEPLQVDADDRWDGRLLGEAIDLGVKLEDFQRDIRAQLLGARGLTVADVVPSDFPARGAERSLDDLHRAEALVAAMVAFQAARIDGLPLVSVLGDIAGLRERGASWIIVVAAWNLVRDRMIAALARITDLVTGLLVPAVAPAGFSPATGGGGSTSTGGGGGGGGGASGGSTSGTSSTGTDSGGTSGSGSGGDGSGSSGGGGGEPTGGGSSPAPDCGSQLDCTVQDVLGGVGGAGDSLDLP
jgi:hypothetical protein